MKFKVDLSCSFMNGKLIYTKKDYAFDFIDYSIEKASAIVGKKSQCSICVDTLQIEVGIETGVLIYVWGYFPQVLYNYVNATLIPPSALNGAVYVNSEELSMQQGVGYRIPESSDWITYRDVISGWICIGNYDIHDMAIQFAQDVVLVLKDQNAVALWMKPIMFDIHPHAKHK